MEIKKGINQSQQLPKLAPFKWPRIDPAIFAIFAILGVVAVFDLPYVSESVQFTAKTLVRISPFFFLSIGVAGYAKALGLEHLIANIFTEIPTCMVILAALFGA